MDVNNSSDFINTDDAFPISVYVKTEIFSPNREELEPLVEVTAKEQEEIVAPDVLNTYSLLSTAVSSEDRICNSFIADNINPNVNDRKSPYRISDAYLSFNIVSRSEVGNGNLSEKTTIRADDTCQPESTYVCEYCGKYFRNETFLQNHARVHTGKKPYLCLYCQKTFCYRYNLRRHMKVHDDRKRYTCQFCQKPFRRKEQLKYHEMTHTGERPHCCTYCDKRFTLKATLQKHLKTHTGEKPYSCDHCGRNFGRKSQLPIHIRTHFKVKDVNGFVLSTTDSNETESVPSISSGDSKVTNDFFRMTTTTTLVRKPAGNLICYYCEKKFRDKNSLTIHIRLHTGEKPFTCIYCEKTFAARANQQRHIKTHEGGDNRLFNCDECAKPFRSRAQLRVHMLHHTGEKPYGCNYCDKRFSERRTLKKHLIIHTGERPYSCENCDKRYRYRVTLNVHRKSHAKLSGSESKIINNKLVVGS